MQAPREAGPAQNLQYQQMQGGVEKQGGTTGLNSANTVTAQQASGPSKKTQGFLDKLINPALRDQITNVTVATLKLGSHAIGVIANKAVSAKDFIAAGCGFAANANLVESNKKAEKAEVQEQPKVAPREQPRVEAGKSEELKELEGNVNKSKEFLTKLIAANQDQINQLNRPGVELIDNQTREPIKNEAIQKLENDNEKLRQKIDNLNSNLNNYRTNERAIDNLKHAMTNNPDSYAGREKLLENRYEDRANIRKQLNNSFDEVKQLRRQVDERRI